MTSSLSGCYVTLALVSVWSWQPLLTNADSTHMMASSSEMRDAAGALLGTIILTTGGHERNGNWTPLVSTKTLTWPTGYTDIPPVYTWWSTGPNTATVYPFATVAMQPRITYSATGSSILSAPTAQGGFRWTPVGVYNPLNTNQLAWFRSVYSDQSVLSKCHVTSMDPLVTRPPVAVQLTRLQATQIREPSQAQPTLTGSLNDLGTLGQSTSSTEPQPTIQSDPFAANSPTARVTQEESGVPIASDPSVQPPTSMKASSGGFSPPGTNKVSPKNGHIIQASVPHGKATGSGPSSAAEGQLSSRTAEETRQITLEDSQVLRPIASGGYSVHSGPTLFPGGPATVYSGTTYSLMPSGTALIVNSRTLRVPNESFKAPEGTSHHPEVSMRSGEVLFQGHTLAMTSTLTLGSGSVFTRLALGTNSVGKTILLGDTTTLARTNGLSRYAIPSSSEVETPVVPSPQVASTSGTSSTASSSASHDIVLISPICWMFTFAVVLLAAV